MNLNEAKTILKKNGFILNESGPDYIDNTDADLTDVGEVAKVLTQYDGNIYIYNDETNKTYRIHAISDFPRGCAIHVRTTIDDVEPSERDGERF